MPRPRTSLCIVFVLAVGCSSGRGAPAWTPDDRDPELRTLDSLALIATGSPLPRASRYQLAGDLDRRALSLDDYLDSLLNDERFATDIAPRIILRADYQPQYLYPDGFVLKHFEDRDGPVYYLHQPCQAPTAERVHPWWDPERTVRICRDSYRPQVLGDRALDRTCDALAASPTASPTCGCGPQLVFCTRDRAHQAEMKSSAVDEVRKTASYVVKTDLPTERLFRMNETFRDGRAEQTYRRWRVAEGEQVSMDVSDWPAGGQLARRFESVPGEHAGLLTTPQFLFLGDALRSSMKYFFEVLWCTEISSSKVSTHELLSIDAVNLRVGEGWEKLAAMPVCTTCHARLDYGMQFFAGFPSAIRGLHFIPQHSRRGNGPLYGEDHADFLGEAPLTPQGFTELAVQRPEFLRCMARHVTDYVFRGQDSPGDYAAVLAAFQDQRTVKAAMRAALRRFATSTASELDAGATAPGRAPTTNLRALLGEHCLDCHDSTQPEPRNFDRPRLSRPMILAMLNAVGSGMMPRNRAGFDRATRLQLLRELASAGWPDDETRAAMFQYFAGGMKAAPVYELGSALHEIHALAGRTAMDDWALVEATLPGPQMSYTPGFAAVVALEALRACKETSQTGDDLQRCFERASQPDNLLVERPISAEGAGTR